MTNDEIPGLVPHQQINENEQQKNSAMVTPPQVSNNLSTPDTTSSQNSNGIIEPTSSQITTRLRNDRWKNRRKMAWLSLYAIIFSVSSLLFLGGFGIITIEAIVALTPIIQFFIGTLGGIIGAYIGFATIQFINEDKFGVNK